MHGFPRFERSLRLRNFVFEAKRKRIQYDSYIDIHISFDAEFYADSESEVKKIFLPHFRENHVLENLRGRIQKF